MPRANIYIYMLYIYIYIYKILHKSIIYALLVICIYMRTGFLRNLVNSYKTTAQLQGVRKGAAAANGTWEKLAAAVDLSEKKLTLGMDQYLLISFLGGWTSIYQLFWCSPGVQGFDTLPFQNHERRGNIQTWTLQSKIPTMIATSRCSLLRHLQPQHGFSQRLKMLHLSDLSELSEFSIFSSLSSWSWTSSRRMGQARCTSNVLRGSQNITKL